MPKKIVYLFLLFSFLSFGFYFQTKLYDDARFVSYIVNPKKQNILFFFKNNKNENFGNASKLKKWLKTQKKELLFATNGGMYKKDHSPQGLYIEKNKIISKIDTTSGNGNFYLKPNGIFYFTNDKKVSICETTKFVENKNIEYATQSGPMLVIDGKIHNSFKENSTNINIRNGVGISPNNQVVFAMSKEEINFYDFANYFKNLGCKNALYLDGFVSRTYLPEKKWIQTDGEFGVIIAITK
jgi:uncharacterized protein YigE (DUF2233 family)